MNMVQLSVKPLTKYNTKKRFSGKKQIIINYVAFQYGPYYLRTHFCNRYWMLLTYSALSHHFVVFFILSLFFPFNIKIFAEKKGYVLKKNK